MTSWTRELDEAATLATQKGYWHIILFYLLCGLASIPTSFLVFSQVFTNATPDHWCAPPPELEGLDLSESLLRNLTVPENDGVFETCSSYALDTRAVIAAWNTYNNKSTEIIQEDDIMRTIQSHKLPPSGTNEEHDKKISRIVEIITLIRSEQKPCVNGWRFSTQQYTKTLVTEYSLVCEKEWLPRTSNTLFWVGSIFGNLLFGWMSDRYGRRPTILLMVTFEVPLAIAAAFPGSYATYIALRVVSGLFFPAMYQLPFVLAMELMPPSRRTNAGIVVGMLFASGMSLLALIAYIVRDWFHLSLATSLPFLLLYGYFWLIPESPRWLVGRGRIAEAEKVLRGIAKKNGIQLEPGFLFDIHKEFKEEESDTANTVELSDISDKDNLDLRINNMLTYKSVVTVVSEKKHETECLDRLIYTNNLEKKDANEIYNERRKTTNHETNKEPLQNLKSSHLDSQIKPIKAKRSLVNRVLCKEESVDLDQMDNRIIDDGNSEGDCTASPLDLLRYPNIRRKFLILTFDWLSLGVIYNSLSYNTSNLGVNEYLAFFIGGVVELPSYIIAWRLMERFGRRWVLCSFMCVGGLACLSCVLVPDALPWGTAALATLGRLCAAASFAALYVLLGELLPTVLRSQAMGLVSFVSGLALLACPYIVHLAVYSRALPLTVMGVLSVLVGVTSLFLPETLNQPLPQTVEDGEMFGREMKIFSCVDRPE